MVTRRQRSVGLAAAVGLLAATFGATLAAAQQDDAAPQGNDDAALLARLDALEPQLPADPAPTSITIDAESTWGSFEGDVTGAAATLETVESDLLGLYVDADDADSPVADAVADVARGWLDLQQGYQQLAAWEAADLAFPLDASDTTEVSTDADELAGRAETGLRLVLGARARHIEGYVALRDAGAAEPAVQERLDTRAAESEAWDQDVRPLVQRLLALRSTQVLVPVERFETSAPGVEARARTMTVTCVDRDAYGEALDAVTAEEQQVDEVVETVTELEDAAVRQDCPALAEEQDVREAE